MTDSKVAKYDVLKKATICRSHYGCMLLWLLLICCATNQATAQLNLNWLKTNLDTNYVKDYTRLVTTRLYFSNKYASYGVRDNQLNKNLIYRPNSRLNVGIGLNYRFLGLNLGVNMPFVNNDNDRYGQTKYLDAQSHVYLSKLTVDLYLQYYKGYYVSNPQEWIENWQKGDPFPKRGDMKTISAGLNVHYIFNNERFSYRASYLQNEWQKKSAGTFLLGADFYLVNMLADSSVVAYEETFPAFFREIQFNKSKMYSLGINSGYAHTFVYKSNFFITLSLIAGIGTGITRLEAAISEELQRFTLQLNNTARVAVGYNSPKYYVGLSFVNLSLRTQTPVRLSSIAFDTGNIRFNICKRFAIEPARIIKRWRQSR